MERRHLVSFGKAARCEGSDGTRRCNEKIAAIKYGGEVARVFLVHIGLLMVSLRVSHKRKTHRRRLFGVL